MNNWNLLKRRQPLWMNQNGMIVCKRHGGSYLQAAVEDDPRAFEYSTPLDQWDRLVPQDWWMGCDFCE